MKMKSFSYILFTIVALVVVGCGQAATPAAIPTISLDSGSQPASNLSGSVTASGVVIPVRKVQLSFPNGGVVKTVEIAAGDLVNANQPLVTLDPAILEARVAEAEAAVVTTETQLTYLKRTGASQERLDAAQANIDAATAAVDIARAQLAQATLTAPFDGTIASVEISPAEFANPGQVVIAMGDLTHFQVETTDLGESDVPAVKPGQTANLYIEALNQEVSGTVIDIARVSEILGGDVVYTVTISFDEQPDGLLWGMSAEVRIETE
jgi:RND family efflux transporter MFP subunit